MGASVEALAPTLPRILLAPLAGALVDRWDRRLVLSGSDLGAALVTLALALLALGARLEVWHAYAAVTLGSVAASFQRPAAMVSVSLLLDEEHFARASGFAAPSWAGLARVARNRDYPLSRPQAAMLN